MTPTQAPDRTEPAPPAPVEILERLPTPPLVEAMLGRLRDRTPERLRDAEQRFKLSYYFGGLYVAARRTPAGLEIVASGPCEEVIPVVPAVGPDDDPPDVFIMMPETIEELIEGLMPNRVPGRGYP